MIDPFAPYDLSGTQLANRIVMAPMTRSRAPEDVATERVALYYTQRASAGLIITEGTPISREGQGYLFNPGIFTPEQIAGWKLTTDSVHSVGGRIFAQVWHVGRVSHVSIQSDNAAPVSATGRPARDSSAYGYSEAGEPGFVPVSAPRALTTAEVGRVVADFARAAHNAVEAGFDGIELHAANGYLFDQFLNPHANDRSDQYGPGTIGSRIRFTLEVVDAVSAAIGRERIGIRLSPYGTIHDMPHFPDLQETFLALGQELGSRGIAYVHVMDQSGFFFLPEGKEPTTDAIIRLLEGWRPMMPETALMLAGRMTTERMQDLLDRGLIDLAAFGQPFISNPDLVTRLRHNRPLTPSDRATYYGGGAKGYIDYAPAA
ncbi:alkene reductase [Marinivivus vitaminiproducens]|uniref:alkene reductase n=1 Tax=Marinivivus vitaminiproducens TaxID=3035935 RepID=UPI00279ABD3B|nr:alkene reductase [Geminicoccaceae bacterium SCSIO 64248]